jgi:dephospho-CoA kinase
VDGLGLNVRRIGITGGIGSGKSTAAAMMAAVGAPLVDIDAISRSLCRPGGGAMASLSAAFGPVAIDADGGLDRAFMRELVFQNRAALAKLESILHPMIRAQADIQVAAATAAGGPPVVLDIPLLAESSAWRGRLDRVLVIDCSVATQLLRVTQRPGWTRDAARRVIEQQAMREARRGVADAVIFNDELDLAELRSQVRLVWGAWAEGN